MLTKNLPTEAEGSCRDLYHCIRIVVYCSRKLRSHIRSKMTTKKEIPGLLNLGEKIANAPPCICKSSNALCGNESKQQRMIHYSSKSISASDCSCRVLLVGQSCINVILLLLIFY
jgi:hypothetical protein